MTKRLYHRQNRLWPSSRGALFATKDLSSMRPAPLPLPCVLCPIPNQRVIMHRLRVKSRRHGRQEGHTNAPHPMQIPPISTRYNSRTSSRQPAIGNHRKPPNPNAGRRSNRHFLMRLEIAVTSSKQSIDYRPNRNIWDPPTDSKCPGGDAKLASAFWIYLPSQERIFG